jgi:hypothetical protein
MTYLQLPTEILPHLRRLSAVQLAIWADAWTWQQNGKESRRSNSQFGEMLGISSKGASDAINGLRRAGFIEWKMDGGGRVLTASIPPAELLPSGRTSTLPSNFHPVELPPPSGSTSTPPPVELPDPLPSNFHQIEKVIEKGKKKGIEKGEVVLPWETESFKIAWAEWLEYKRAQHKFTYKRTQDEQTALHQLQKHSDGKEPLAIHIIATSISNGWKGLFASSAKSYLGAGARSGSYLRPSGKYEHPADVLKDRDIWG